MSKAIDKLKELYLFSSIALNSEYPNDIKGEPIYNTRTIQGLIECIRSYINLKGFELNYDREFIFPYGVITIDDNLIRARFKDRALYILVKYQDKTKDDYRIKLEKEVKECGAYFFLATITNANSFQDFVNWFENEIIEKEG